MVNKVKESNIDDNSITTSKVEDSAITTAKINADAITEAKIADNAISEEHLDTTVVTGLTELSESANDSDVLIIYDTSAGTLKKIQKSNVSLAVPTVSSVSPTSVTSGDNTGNYTFTITGTGFDATASAKLITTGGADVSFDTVTRDSSTQVTGVVAKSSLTNANEPYGVKVINSSGLASSLIEQISIDAAPIFDTAAGSIGSIFDGGRTGVSLDVVAYDPESAGSVTFELLSGSLPSGLSSSTINENGVSKFRISGNATQVVSNTTSTFRVRAADANSNTNVREFSITVYAAQSTSFTTSGTFTVPSGLSSVSVLVVGGGGSGGAQHAGGGGAGGLIYMPAYPINTSGGTITVTVGCGGSLVPNTSPGLLGQDSVFGSPGDPGLGCGGVLTAKGGGGGAMGPAGPLVQAAQGGGSGGGGGYYPTTTGGSATQPTQPGNSGAYGFGNAGGSSTGSGAQLAGSGGGGAGAVGAPSTSGAGAAGGAGKAYTIADGTTPVYYAGGGGGASHQPGGPGTGGVGGQGGGGTGGHGTPSGGPPATAAGCGTANRGGGGGGAFYQQAQSSPSPYGGAGACQGKGGKGIVIVSF